MTWLRAFRRARYLIHEVVMIVINVAGAAAVCGVAYALCATVQRIVQRVP